MALQAEVLYVNPDYMKRLTQLNGGVEDAVMVPAIILAQDKYLQQYLGADLHEKLKADISGCLLYTSPSPRDGLLSRMPSSA